MKDVFDFLRLDCAGDVINATFPYFDPKTMLNRALAIMRALRPHVLSKNHNSYRLVAYGSVGSLTAVLAAHLFKSLSVTCYGRGEMLSGFKNVHNFYYYSSSRKDQYNPSYSSNTILVCAFPETYQQQQKLLTDFQNHANIVGLVFIPRFFKNEKNISSFLLKNLSLSAANRYYWETWMKFKGGIVPSQISLKFHQDKSLGNTGNTVISLWK